MSVIDLIPDLGPVATLDHQGETMINVAGVLEMARSGATPEARCLHRAFSVAYAHLDGSPLSEGERQWRAIRMAWAELRKAFPQTPPLVDRGRI